MFALFGRQTSYSILGHCKTMLPVRKVMQFVSYLPKVENYLIPKQPKLKKLTFFNTNLTQNKIETVFVKIYQFNFDSHLFKG